MSLSSVVNAVRNTKWQKTDDFIFSLTHKNEKLNVTNIIDGVTKDVWEKSVIGFNIPELATPAYDTYLGGEWRISSSKPEVFRISVRFRDFNNGELRRYFGMLSAYGVYNYLEDAAIQMKITAKAEDTTIFSANEMIIENVSGTDYSTTTSDITEFTVQFRSAYYSDDYLSNFGNHTYADKFVNKLGF